MRRFCALRLVESVEVVFNSAAWMNLMLAPIRHRSLIAIRQNTSEIDIPPPPFGNGGGITFNMVFYG